MGLSIDIAANTTAAQRGIKDLSKTLDGVADALDDVADDSDKSGDRVERSFRDMTKAAQDTGREAGRSFSKAAQALDDVERQAKRTERAVDDIGDSGKRGFSKAGEAAGEFKQEALQNLSEVTSSFDGSMDSITDLVQGTLGGIASSIPGIGLAGAAAAVGVGAIAAAFNANDAAAKESQQRAAEWAQAYIDAGALIVNSATQVANVQAIASDPERYAQAQENARNWGVDVSTAMNAMAGNATALKVAQDQLADTDRRVNEELHGMGTQYRDIADDLTGFASRTAAGKESMAQLTREMDAGRVTASQVSESFKSIVSDAGDAAVEVDDLGNKLVTLPDNTQVFIDAQTGQASQAISRFKGDADGVIDHVNGREVVLQARAAVDQAQRDINRFMTDNDGRSFTMYGRVKVDSGAMP